MRKSELDQTGPDVNLRVSAGLQESGGGRLGSNEVAAST